MPYNNRTNKGTPMTIHSKALDVADFYDAHEDLLLACFCVLNEEQVKQVMEKFYENTGYDVI
jgi:hypothetical protein